MLEKNTQPQENANYYQKRDRPVKKRMSVLVTNLVSI